MYSSRKDFQVRIKPFESTLFGEIQDRLRLVLESVLDEARSEATPNSRGHVSIDLANLKDKYINTRVADIHLITAEDILNAIERTLNSNQAASCDNFLLHIVYGEH